MPSITLEVSVENGQRLIAALEPVFPRNDGEDPFAYVKRAIRTRLAGVVRDHEASLASEAVLVDNDIIT